MTMSFVEDKLNDLKEWIDDINSAIDNWHDFDELNESMIKEYTEEDVILRDLVKSLLIVYNDFSSRI